MNKENHEKQQVVLAALIHHIGIFFYHSNGGEITENTAKFCDKLQAHNPALEKIALWKQLATETTDSHLKQLIKEAHYFAISEQNDKNNPNTHYLQSILEKITLNQNDINQKTNYYLPLTALSLEQKSIYPIQNTNKTATQDYKNLETVFWNAFDKTPHFNQLTHNTLPHLAYNLLSLFERFFSQVPALENTEKNTTSDISLFDHLRVKAAIAEGLYEFHQKDSFSNTDFSNEITTKWSLICGDFSGIQSFIYNIVHKNAAKALRGRSLYIQLLCDAVSQHLTQQLNLFPTSQIYSSGGKFYLLIPIDKVEKLKQEVVKINEKLLAEFRGLVFLGIGSANVCATDFFGGNMGDKWKQVSEDLMQDRLQRFKPLIVKNTDFFEPISLHFSDKVDKQFCEVCGRDDVAADLRKTSDDKVICSQCHSLEKLGKSLHTQDHLYFLWKWDKNQQINTGLRIPLLFCDLFILEKSQLENVAIQTANDRIFLEKINHFDNTALTTDLAKNINVGFRFAGIWNNEKNQYLEKLECYQQQQEQVGFDFNNFAECSTGIKRAGILRMDVDNLGQVFVNGLNFENKTMGSLSRVATLSRQLNLFFSGHLNELLKKYQRTQIIYAGGDDLFLIGSWDELPDVAHEIRTQFTQYCAENPNFTISGGIAMVRGRYPISRAAQLAGEQESKAKNLEYISLKTKQDKTKDTFCFLETAIPWERYEQIVEFRDKIESIIQKSDNRAIIDRLRQVVLAMQEFERLSKKQDKDVNEIKQLVMWQKWRWRLVYNLARMADRYPNSDIEQELEYIKTIIFEDRIGDSKLTVSHWLPLPVRWVEFLTRKGRA